MRRITLKEENTSAHLYNELIYFTRYSTRSRSPNPNTSHEKKKVKIRMIRKIESFERELQIEQDFTFPHAGCVFDTVCGGDVID